MCLLTRRVKKNFSTLIFKINIICIKQFYAVNCQVCCDAQRRVTYLSAMCPGATPFWSNARCHSEWKVEREVAVYRRLHVSKRLRTLCDTYPLYPF